MKKTISLLLSVMMIFSALSVMPVMAADDGMNIVTDVADKNVLLFKDYITTSEKSFDETYFFLGEFEDVNSYSDFQFVITTNSTEELELAVGLVKDGEAKAVGAIDLTTGYVTVKEAGVSSDNSFVIVAETLYNSVAPCYFGVAVQNPTAIGEGVWIKVETQLGELAENEAGDALVFNTQEEVVDSISYTFPTPVSLKTEGLEPVGKVLTALSLGKDFTSEDAIAAVGAMATVEEIEEDDMTILNEKLTNDILQLIANKITKDSSITINNEAGAVELPWIVLSAVADTYEVEAVEKEIEIPNYESKAYDITIKANGNVISEPAMKQKVVIDIPNGWDKENIKYAPVSFDSEGKASLGEQAEVTIEGSTAVFYAEHFSTYTLIGKKVVADENNAAEKVNFTMEQNDAKKNEFALYIEPTNGQINNFVAAAMKYEFYITDSVLGDEKAMENFTYSIIPEAGISITNRKDIAGNGNNIAGGLQFVATVDDPDENPVSGDKIKIATITINGTGSFYYVSNSFESHDAVEATKIMYCETITDNGVVRVQVTDNYNAAEKIVYEIPELKYNLKIKVDFDAQLKDDEGNYKDEYSGLYILSDDADYVGMTLTVKGSKSGEVANVKLGSDDMPITITKVGTETTESYAETTGTLWDLPANETYTFEVSGKGYRTFYGDVFLDADKTVYIWNNAYDKGHEVNVVTDDADTAEAVAFLVGDIYMDGIVDVYDLSAVTSYFNKTVGAAGSDTYNKYIPYDLNRDGKITLTDIAYVQASYGN